MDRPEPARKIVIFGALEHPSGAPMAALRLAHGLSGRGHAVRAALLYRLQGIPAPDYPFEVLHPGPKPGIRGSVQIFLAALALLRRERPDCVISFLPAANVVGQLAALLSGVRHRIVTPRVPISTYSAAMRVIDVLLARCGVYTSVVAPTRSVLESCAPYPSRLRRRASVVHNGLLNWRASSLSREAARRRFGIDPDTFALVAVGRLYTQKNHLFLLPVLERLEGTTLLIAGDGELRAQVEQEIEARQLQSRVRLLGDLPKPEVSDLLAAGDLFVQPSLYEGQSNALIEALSSGLPALVSDQPEQRETIESDDGMVAGAALPLDTQAWIDAINGFRRDAGRLDAVRVQALARARDFSFAKMVTGFESHLRGFEQTSWPRVTPLKTSTLSK